MADMKYDVDTSDLVRARKEIRQWRRDNSEAFDRVNSRMQTFGKTSDLAFNQFGRAASRAQQRSKRFASVGLQQAGYQIGDFAVQVQGGTNALVAFGQQGSQLAGILGPGGAVLGAVIAIGTAVLNVVYETNKAKQSMKEWKESLESARETVKGMADDLEALRSGIENAFERTLTDNVRRAEERLKAAREALEAFPDATPDRSRAAAMERERAAAEEAVRLAERELLSAQELLRQQKEEERQASINNQLYEARVILREKEEEITRAIAKGISASRGPAQTVRLETEKHIQAMAAVFKNTQKLKDKLGEATFEALRFSNVDMSSPISKATMEAAELAGRLTEAFGYAVGINEAMSRSNRQDKTYSGRGGDPRTVNQQGYGSVDAPDIDAIIERFRGTGSSGGGGTQTDPRAFLESLQKELDLKRLLVGVNEAQAERLKLESQLKERLNEVGQQITEEDRKRIDALVRQAEAIRRAEAAEESRRDSIERFENQMSDSITNIVKETESLQDAFLNVIGNIVEQLYKQNVADPIASGIGDILGGIFGGATANANGNAFRNGKVTAFATGGVVDKPTMFPMANGAGLMGEAGPEAIMPLKRGKNGKLGVQTEGSQAPVVIHQSFNFSANGDDSVKRIISQEAPKIAELTQKQILAQRSRGGVWKTTFG